MRLLFFLLLISSNVYAQSEVVFQNKDQFETNLNSFDFYPIIRWGKNYMVLLKKNGPEFFEESKSESDGLVFKGRHARVSLSPVDHPVGIDLSDTTKLRKGDGRRRFSIKHVEDLDGDGLKDLIITISSTSGIFWCKKIENGKYGQPAVTNSIPEFKKEQVSVYLQNQFVTFHSRQLVGYTNVNSLDLKNTFYVKSRHLKNKYFIGIADFTNDSIMDYLYTGSGEMFLIIGNGKPKTRHAKVRKLKIQVENETFLADINGDGKVDILGGTNNNLYLYQNLGKGQFSPSIPLVDSNIIHTVMKDGDDYGFGYVLTLDYDNDGDMDILNYSEYILLIENLGNNSFEYHRLGSGPYDPGDLAVADVDLDGDLDFVYNTHLGLSILENNAGEFTEVILNNCGLSDVNQLIDLDSDGDLDFLIEGCSYNLMWSENTATGFSTPVPYQLSLYRD
jgi:hypothetical protein